MSRHCNECEKDISYRGNRAIRCEVCQIISHKLRNREYQKKWANEHQESHRISNKKYYNRNMELMAKRKLAYNKTENGKLSHRKSQHRRYRDLNFIELFINPFPEEMPVDYHHINDILVIYRQHKIFYPRFIAYHYIKYRFPIRC